MFAVLVSSRAEVKSLVLLEIMCSFDTDGGFSKSVILIHLNES